ncbi:hypothetical protein NIES4075_04880 [Tolypothrix sp. NIES-4075]|nr:hypothetical protein NIES4075_04880 [Tolypothrix sp. NIES-4075]
MPFRILSLDGGEIRFLVAARILAAIEIAYFPLLKAIARALFHLRRRKMEVQSNGHSRSLVYY